MKIKYYYIHFGFDGVLKECNNWLETNPAIRHIHVTQNQEGFVLTYHYEE